MHVQHTLNPFYNENSKILILGTMPSLKSREYGFYYMHPQNRFWKVLSSILEEEYPSTIYDKKNLLNKYNIALWDVLESCDINGSSDSSIKNPKANDIQKLICNTKIRQVFVTGKKALDLYNRFVFHDTDIKPIYLPSTSPANQTITYDQLKEKYMVIKEYLKHE